MAAITPAGGRAQHVLTTAAPPVELAAAASALVWRRPAWPPEGSRSRFDVYTWEDGTDGPAPACRERALAEPLAPLLDARPERVVVAREQLGCRAPTSARCGT